VALVERVHRRGSRALLLVRSRHSHNVLSTDLRARALSERKGNETALHASESAIPSQLRVVWPPTVSVAVTSY
jgi:hypothetical protein